MWKKKYERKKSERKRMKETYRREKNVRKVGKDGKRWLKIDYLINLLAEDDYPCSFIDDILIGRVSDLF